MADENTAVAEETKAEAAPELSEFDINSLIDEGPEPKEAAPEPEAKADAEAKPEENKAAAEESPASASAKKQEQAEHPQWLLAKCAAYGISAVEANRYPAEVLIDHIEKTAAAAANRNPSREESTPQPKEQDEIDLPEDQYDPQLVKAIKGQSNRIKQLEKQLAESNEAMRRQNADKLRSDIDGWIEKLPDAVKGQVDRRELIATMSGIHRSQQEIGKAPTHRQVFDRAVRSLYDLPTVKEEPTAEEIESAAELERRKEIFQKGVAEPTQRHSKQPPKKGDGAAKAFAKDWLDANGLSSEDEKEILNSFPE